VNKENKYFLPEHESNDLLKMQDIGTYLIFFHRKVENALIKLLVIQTTNCIALFPYLIPGGGTAIYGLYRYVPL